MPCTRTRLLVQSRTTSSRIDRCRSYVNQKTTNANNWWKEQKEMCVSKYHFTLFSAVVTFGQICNVWSELQRLVRFVTFGQICTDWTNLKLSYIWIFRFNLEAKIVMYRGKKSKSRFIAKKGKFNDFSREKANFAIFRGKTQISRYRD